MPSLDSSTPSSQTPRTPDSVSRAGKTPLSPSLPKAPESQSSYSRPVVESEPESEPAWSPPPGDGDTNTLDGEVTPLPSPSAASSTIFTPTDNKSARSPVPSLSPPGPAPALKPVSPSSTPLSTGNFLFRGIPPTNSPAKFKCGGCGMVRNLFHPCPDEKCSSRVDWAKLGGT